MIKTVPFKNNPLSPPKETTGTTQMIIQDGSEGTGNVWNRSLCNKGVISSNEE